MSQNVAFRKALELTEKTGVKHSECDICYTVLPSSELEYLEDREGVCLVVLCKECNK